MPPGRPRPPSGSAAAFEPRSMRRHARHRAPTPWPALRDAGRAAPAAWARSSGPRVRSTKALRCEAARRSALPASRAAGSGVPSWPRGARRAYGGDERFWLRETLGWWSPRAGSRSRSAEVFRVQATSLAVAQVGSVLGAVARSVAGPRAERSALGTRRRPARRGLRPARYFDGAPPALGKTRAEEQVDQGEGRRRSRAQRRSGSGRGRPSVSSGSSEGQISTLRSIQKPITRRDRGDGAHEPPGLLGASARAGTRRGSPRCRPRRTGSRA